MAQPMPASNPFLNFPYGPLRMECEAVDLIIEGEIPAELNGSFYRAGPNQRFAPRGDYHLFAGDGMVHAFHIGDGKVDYINRWVRTTKWLEENRQGRALINAMNPFDCEPEYSDFVLTDKDGLANTAAVWHGGRMLIMEEGHQPFEVDPDTLESIGTWNFRGKLHTAMTAHPKVDPDTGELVFFAYMATGPFSSDMAIHKVSPDGLLTESVVIPTPYSSMIHDFVITENYIVMPVMPISGSLDRAMEGGPPFAWEPDKGVHIGLMPRHGGTAEDIRWIEMDLNFAFHFMNAYDQDGVICVDACQFEQAPLFPTPDGESTGASHPHLTRWTCDLNQENPRFEFERISENESEFPQCDPRYVGKPYRHGWFTTPDGTVKSDLEANNKVYNCVGYYDHETGAEKRYSCGNAMISEAIMVPRSADAPEGDGFVLTVVTSFESRLSSLYIFDSKDVSKGPLAKAHLPHHVPVGFHGTWKSGNQ